FLLLFMEQEFEGYKFLPFLVWSYNIEGLYVKYAQEKKCNVFHALFSNLDMGLKFIGSRHYKIEDWVLKN
ncbi:MAG: hypothetical protein AAGJ18_22845, partial [Bacteroidota bacterium]